MKKSLIALTIFCAIACAVSAYALSVGDTVWNIQLRDSADNPAVIPDLGSKVVMITYADSTAADANDALATAVKNKGYAESVYRGQGVANLADSKWIPNSAIRAMVRKKEAQFNTTILTDADRSLPTQWGLGNVDDVSVVILIGKDMKVKFVNYGTVYNVDEVIALIDQEIAK
jgi:predicted transcriptional regulator